MDTDRPVAVVPVALLRVNAGFRKRDSTVTVPFEKTFANPAAMFPLLCVANVMEPPGGMRNEMFGSVMASGIRLPLLWKKSTMPWTATVVDGFRMVIIVVQSAPPAVCATVFTNGNICDRATPPGNCVEWMLTYAVSGAVISALSVVSPMALAGSTVTTRVMLPAPVVLSTVLVPLRPVLIMTGALIPATPG